MQTIKAMADAIMQNIPSLIWNTLSGLPFSPSSKASAELWLSRGELWLVVFAILIGVGLIGEVRAEKQEKKWIPPKHRRDWVAIFTWVVIVAVIGELFCDADIWVSSDVLQTIADGELTKLNAELTLAQQETAKANKATEELRHQNLELEQAVSPRLLDQSAAAKVLQSLPGTALLAAVPDFEARRFVGQLTIMFQLAAWNVAPLPDDGRPIFDGIDVECALAPGFTPDGDRWRAAEALVVELKRQTIDARVSIRPPNISPEALIIRVGAKPIMHFLERLNPELKEIRERIDRHEKDMEEFRKKQ
jgi:hypothetical protein